MSTYSHKVDTHTRTLELEGVMLKELTLHPDERGFFMELIRSNDAFFAEGFGQLSHSKMYPGVVKAWHVHKNQVDWWYVPIGRLRVALYDTRPKSPTFKKTIQLYLGEGYTSSVLKIPAGVAHGCKAIGETVHLFYVTSHIYDTAEEGRISYQDQTIGYNWLDTPEIT
ncbi:dTDP-4-dehydrorhamnose 3,5-epimerase family protein [Dictyobacter kobayashii]|uniref:Spore coat polysaccharide biosynthesis protein SpsL n=1 Tax=Dictyobacter kobayashii TaxID=2014872 RepID=A0A402AC88_9CHLR|nr:dTDP-4-dehydrorhamnose 3,5-epimerase family protein [Dictyobacter kobayashii]GCE16701.1 spore coat polysaccharide biosynthesis protein SpsL [Dictyobacter kobayashii]